MQWGIGYPLSAIREGAATVVGWTVVIGITVLVGIVVGYWLGHGEIVAPGKTFEAILWLPVVWLIHPKVLIAYSVAVLAWYLPIHCESERLRFALALVNLLTWIVIVGVEVEQCSRGKLCPW